MKKIFTLLAAALVSCTMFVSCGDNDEYGKVSVAFGEESWNAKQVYAEVADNNLLEIGAYENYENDNKANIEGYVPNAVLSTTYSADNYYRLFYLENADDYTEINGGFFPNWQPKPGFAEAITAIDLTELTLSGTANGIMYRLNDEQNVANMMVTIDNIQWASWPTNDAKSRKVFKAVYDK